MSPATVEDMIDGAGTCEADFLPGIDPGSGGICSVSASRSTVADCFERLSIGDVQ